MRFILTRLRGLCGYRELFWQLVVVGIKLKYRRSVLGYLWSVLNPLLIMVIMALVFSSMFRFDIPNYPVYLLGGSLLFNFMSDSTQRGMTSILDNAAMLKKIYIPKYIFTAASVSAGLVNLLFSLAALVLVMLITRAPLTWHILLAPLVIFELYLFCLGLALFLATATVFFRDMQYLWGVITTAWMYMTPIFYPPSIWPERYAIYFKALNPMYSYIAQFRDLVLGAQLPGAHIVLAGFGYALLALALGCWAFYRGQDRFILHI